MNSVISHICTTKPRKAPYRKSEAVKDLERLADEAARLKYPYNPYLAARLFRDDSANGLTKCITAYIQLKSGFASRVNNQGTFIKKLNKYIPSTAKKGLPDIIAQYQGKSLFVEVKIGRDVQSTHQKKVEAEYREAGGLYFIAHNFTDFKQWFDIL